MTSPMLLSAPTFTSRSIPSAYATPRVLVQPSCRRLIRRPAGRFLSSRRDLFGDGAIPRHLVPSADVATARRSSASAFSLPPGARADNTTSEAPAVETAASTRNEPEKSTSRSEQRPSEREQAASSDSPHIFLAAATAAAAASVALVGFSGDSAAVPPSVGPSSLDIISPTAIEMTATVSSTENPGVQFVSLTAPPLESSAQLWAEAPQGAESSALGTAIGAKSGGSVAKGASGGVGRRRVLPIEAPAAAATPATAPLAAAVVTPAATAVATPVAATAVAAAPAAEAAGASLSSFGVNLSVLRASMGAAFKLFAVCAFIVWLMKARILPKSTPSVLSQVAFRAMIPAFLMTKVAATLSLQPLSSLAGLPLVAIMQIVCGALLGKLACSLTYSQPSVPETASHGREAVSAPVGAEAAEAVGERREAVLMAACAFGNSIALPLVFLTALLSDADADRAAGYLALFMVGWSPTFWTYGYNLFTGGDTAPGAEQREGKGKGKGEGEDVVEDVIVTEFDRALESAKEVAKKIFNPPIYGVLAGLLVGATPMGHFFLPLSSSSTTTALAASASTAEAAAAALADEAALVPSLIDTLPLSLLPLDASHLAAWLFSPATAGVLHPVMEAAAVIGSACVAVQAVVLASSLASAIPSRIPLPSFPSLPTFPSLFTSSSSTSSPPTFNTSTLHSSSSSISSSSPLALPCIITRGMRVEPPPPSATAPSAPAVAAATPAPLVTATLTAATAGSLMAAGAEAGEAMAVASAGAMAIVPAVMGQAACFEAPQLMAIAPAVLGQIPGSSVAVSASRPAPMKLHVSTGADVATGEANPAALLDGKALWMVSAVRLVLMPWVAMMGVMGLYNANFIPQDPVCALMLMIQAAMPSAQNLVLMAQLSPATRPLAGVLASMMMRQYALSMIPITVWITVFLSQLDITIR